MAITEIGPDAYFLDDGGEDGNTLLVQKNVTIDAGLARGIHIGPVPSEVSVKVKGTVTSSAAHCVMTEADGTQASVAKFCPVTSGEALGVGVLPSALGVIDGGRGSITLEGYHADLTASSFIFSKFRPACEEGL